MILELILGIGLTFLFYWIVVGGLVECRFANVGIPPNAELLVWFVTYAVFFAC